MADSNDERNERYRKCPGDFCFGYVGPDAIGENGRGPYCNFAGKRLTVCDRDDPPGKVDWYEPCEPDLERAGLARDHFKRPGTIWTTDPEDPEPRKPDPS
jgi:hypothetical protein